MAGSLRDAVAWLESRVGTLRGGATVFALALAVFGVRSIALPVIPGRDFGTYIGYYVQMWDWHSVVPMSQLYRTPLAPLVIGGTLDLFGGWGLRVVMALLFAASVVAWTRTALTFGPRAALVTAVALLVYPGYGILFHTPASEPVAAAAFAAWGLAVARAWVAPSSGRFAVVGAATAATALARPAFQVLVLVSALPLVLRMPWGARLGSAAACAGVALAVLGSWTVANGLRYDDYTVARGTGAFFPFYRAFTTDHIVRPGNGPASRELANAVRRNVLPEEPYRSYGITLDEFFERGGPREFEDVVGITDRLWGWDSDYAHMRAVGIEAVRAHPLRYLSGVGKTTFEELWKPLFVALPNDAAEAPSAPAQPNDDVAAGDGPRTSGPDGRRGDSRRAPGILLDHTGRAHPRTVDVAGGSHARLLDTGDAAALRPDWPRRGRPPGRRAARTLGTSGSRSSSADRRSSFPRRSCGSSPGSWAWSSGGRSSWVWRSRWQVPPRSSSAPRRSRSTRSSSSQSRSCRLSSSSAPRASSGPARSAGGERDEQPLQVRRKIRQPPEDASWSRHPPAARRPAFVGLDGPTASHSASSGTCPPAGTNRTVRRNSASQAG